jgi:MarR family transcriptional regulator, lower aerobic nicotinate degradation pathway regulator
VPTKEPLARPSILSNLPIFAISRLGRIARDGVKDAFTQAGLSWRAHVALLCLREYGELSQRELAGLITMDPSDLVKLLDELERAGLIRREPDPHDRRRRVLSSTPEGRKVLRRGERIVRDATDEILAPLGPERRELLYELVQEIIDAHRAGLPGGEESATTTR